MTWYTNSSMVDRELKGSLAVAKPNDNLASAVLDGLLKGVVAALRERGDTRFLSSPSWSSSSAWLSESLSPPSQVYFLSPSNDEAAWRETLEAAKQFMGTRIGSAWVSSSTNLYNMVQNLTPWELCRVQVSRLPKRRRLPLDIGDHKHRACILMQADGNVVIQAESFGEVATSGEPFRSPVDLAIFIYGTAPATEYGQGDGHPEEPRARPGAEPEVKEAPVDLMWRPHGTRDITFPGVSLQQLPAEIRQLLARMHQNLGHPRNDEFCRWLAQHHASASALFGVKHLRCEVCLQKTKPRVPRGMAIIVARRFGDRLFMDVFFVPLVDGRQVPFLSLLDDASALHIARLMINTDGVLDQTTAVVVKIVED